MPGGGLTVPNGSSHGPSTRVIAPIDRLSVARARPRQRGPTAGRRDERTVGAKALLCTGRLLYETAIRLLWSRTSGLYFVYLWKDILEPRCGIPMVAGYLRRAFRTTPCSGRGLDTGSASISGLIRKYNLVCACWAANQEYAAAPQSHQNARRASGTWLSRHAYGSSAASCSARLTVRAKPFDMVS